MDFRILYEVFVWEKYTNKESLDLPGSTDFIIVFKNFMK